MAFPVAPFDWNPQVEISDEEYKLFHSIDRQLMKTLIDTLGRNSFDAISVVAFLLYLERSRLGAKAVEKVVTQNWPIHLVDMLADQVVALLEWLKNPKFVWEERGDISLIQELCTPKVGFVYFYERRLEILKEKTEIVNEMAANAFKDMFPDGVVDRSVQNGVGQGSGGGAVHVPQEIENMSHGGVQVGSGSGYVHGPRVPERNVGGEFPVFGNFGSGSGINVGAEFLVFGNFGSGSGSSGHVHGPRVPQSNVGGDQFPVFGDFGPGSGGGAVFVPREHVNRHHDGVQIGSAGGHVHGPREAESNVGGEFIFGDFGSGSGGGAELVNRHRDGVQTGSAGGYVHGPREVESNVGGETAAAGVPVYGPPELRSYNHDGAGFEVRGRYVRDPRELINMNHHVAGYGSTAGGLVPGRLNIPDSRQLENRNIGIRVSIPTVPVHNPQEVQANIHNGVGYQADQRLIYDPRPLNSINRNGLGYGPVSRLVRVHPEPEIMNRAGAGGFRTVGGIVPVHPGRLGYGMPRGLVQVHGEPVNMNGDGAGGFGTVGGLVQVHREPENLNGDGSDGDYDDEPISDDEQILPNVPYGPRMRRYMENDGGNPGNSRRLEMTNTRRPLSENELAVLLSGLNIQEEDTHVHDEDKTVFLTFSRGYPVTEPEIWGFFTRRFGNFIKAIDFEEVREGTQPLYARMVARNSSILPLICDVHIRTRYVINGKHVWAKKYVRKHHTAPPRLSTSRADPPPRP